MNDGGDPAVDGAVDGGDLPDGSTAHAFAFATTAYEAYVRVDRAGFPGFNMVFNSFGNQDEYNQAFPDDDAGLEFLLSIRASLETLHYGAPMNQTPNNTGLQDDLMAIGLTPCNGTATGSCQLQVRAHAIPDVLKLDLTAPRDFPNGRAPTEPVMDMVLALALLDLEVNSIDTFMEIPVNPLANDVPLPSTFPYLAPAHE